MGGDRAVTIAAWATDTKLCGDVTLDCNFPSLSRPPPPSTFQGFREVEQAHRGGPIDRQGDALLALQGSFPHEQAPDAPAGAGGIT